MSIDTLLQTQVDTQVLEQGAFAPLEFLIESGRLSRSDYEDWRRRRIDSLDEVLMGSRDKIRAQLEAAVGYARSIGLVEQAQTFHAWESKALDQPLRISADAALGRLIAGRYVPAQSAPQMDLFFDNPVVALTNGIVRALSSRNGPETQRQLDRLYAHSPTHADLAAYDSLLDALGHLEQPIDDPRHEFEFLMGLVPTAKRLLGWEARDLLTPLWRQLAAALQAKAFSPADPDFHRSFALAQAADWTAAGEAVRAEPDWWRHPPLCLRLAASSFHEQRRSEALTAWFHLCWHSPEDAAAALENPRQPDTGIKAQWQRFADSEDYAPSRKEGENTLNPADFPAWVLLRDPGLTLQLPADLPRGDSCEEQGYRCIHRWIDARRAKRTDEEMALRKTLQAVRPLLLQQLKRTA